MNMYQQFKRRVKSPYVLAAIIGVVDLTAGSLGMIADIIWLIGDTVFNTQTFMLHATQYIPVIVLLLLALIMLIVGGGLTIYAIHRYFKTGMSQVESTNEQRYYKQIRQDKIRRRALNKMDAIAVNRLYIHK